MGESMLESPRGLTDLSKLREHKLPLRQAPYTVSIRKQAPHPFLTFHMIKIPSSTDKVKKREEEEREVGETERRLSLALSLSLSPLWDAVAAAVAAGAAANLRVSDPHWMCLRGCVITSHDMFPPLPA